MGGWVLDCLKFALTVPLLLGRRLWGGDSGEPPAVFRVWRPGIVTVGCPLFSRLSLFFLAQPAAPPLLVSDGRRPATGLLRDETRQQRGSII